MAIVIKISFQNLKNRIVLCWRVNVFNTSFLASITTAVMPLLRKYICTLTTYKYGNKNKKKIINITIYIQNTMAQQHAVFT